MSKKPLKLIQNKPIEFASMEDAIAFSNGEISREEVAERAAAARDRKPADSGVRYAIEQKEDGAVTIQAVAVSPADLFFRNFRTAK